MADSNGKDAIAEITERSKGWSLLPPSDFERKDMFERKYEIADNKLVKRGTGAVVPDDEPLFIFRAQDRKALAVLVAYNMLLDDLVMKEAVTRCVNDFRAFQENHPERMKEPTV